MTEALKASTDGADATSGGRVFQYFDGLWKGGIFPVIVHLMQLEFGDLYHACL